MYEQWVNLLINPKHDALRTVLMTGEDDLPLQVFTDELSVSVLVQDFCSGEDDADALAFLRALFKQPFERLGKPLFRYDLAKTSDDCYYWLMQYHPIIVDGYSVALLSRSLAEIYTQLAKGKVPELDGAYYVRFIEHDKAYLTSKAFEQNISNGARTAASTALPRSTQQ